LYPDDDSEDVFLIIQGFGFYLVSNVWIRLSSCILCAVFMTVAEQYGNVQVT